MQIIVAFNLLLALSAFHLQTGSLPFDLVTNSCCVAMAMVMSLILSQTLVFLTQSRFQTEVAVPPSLNRQARSVQAQSVQAELQKSLGLSEDNLQILIWTLFSLLVTFVFRWTAVANEYCGQWVLVPQFVTLSPHLLCLIMMWAIGDWGNATTDLKTSSKIISVGSRLNARFQMLLLPVLLPIAAVYSVRSLLDTQYQWTQLPATTQTIGLSFAAMCVLVFTYPLLLSRLWSTQSLAETHPADHQSLTRLGQKLRLRVSRIERWNTRYRIANAAVVGWIPGVRKILLSDVLTRILTPAELRAVFLHEAGHIRKSHTMWRLTTVLLPLQLLLIGFVHQEMALDSSLWQEQPALIGAALFLFVGSAALLSWFSKQLELEADRYAWNHNPNAGAGNLQNVTDADPLVSAMVKTARVTESSIHQTSLMHPTTANRIRQICLLNSVPEQAAKLDRRLSRVKFSLLLIFLAATLCLGLSAIL